MTLEECFTLYLMHVQPDWDNHQGWQPGEYEICSKIGELHSPPMSGDDMWWDFRAYAFKSGLCGSLNR